MKKNTLDITQWLTFVESYNNPEESVTIGVIGKYISLQDAYKSIYEALIHGAAANRARLHIRKIDPEAIEKCHDTTADAIGSVDGILVPGGFGTRGVEGKIAAVNYARTNSIPYFGICLGLHTAVIEYGRNVCQLENVNSLEFDPECGHPVISIMEDQKMIQDKGATMRLGAFQCCLQENSGIQKIYGTDVIFERHRHRYEFTLKYKEQYEKHGMVFGGINPDSELIETIELPEHPWFYATQFHPEFKSKPVKPHPLFRSFIEAALKKKKMNHSTA